MEPSKRSQAVSDAIRSVFINSYDILQLSGQKSTAILAQARNSTRRLIFAIPIDRMKRDVTVGSLRVADDFLRERAGTAKPKDMLKYLRRAPKVAPNADDMP
jgi:hypothetical protein